MSYTESVPSYTDSVPSIERSNPADGSSQGESDWEEWADEGEVQEDVDRELVKDIDELQVGKTQTKFWTRPRSVKTIVIVYHSLFGNLATMAEEIKRGIEMEENCEAFIYQTEETYSRAFLAKINAAKPATTRHPVITREDLRYFPQADGFLFGMSSRFGSIPASMKAFFDSTGALWLRGGLIGKPAGLFTSSATHGGGSDALALSVITILAHHGMMFVPPALFMDRETDSIVGGSRFGANCTTGLDGVRVPSKPEKALAANQGTNFAAVVTQINQTSL